MKHIVIENLGPIKKVDIELKRFNFFIGPQSCGKSTIAKVISTCEWMEKEVTTLLDEKAIPNGVVFVEMVEKFHKMEGYFNRPLNTHIHYETEVIDICYKDKELSVCLKKEEAYHRQKICYIPAERNMVTLPELDGFEFGQTNLKSFLFDWWRARELHSTDNKMDILGLGMHYYYDKSRDSKKDRIQHDNGVSYDISLSNSSSGLQSVTPLYIMLDYYADKYFEEYNAKSSFIDESKMARTRIALQQKYIFPYISSPSDSKDQLIEKIDNYVNSLHLGDPKCTEIHRGYLVAFKRMTEPNRTTFIIEEPEQNLYPSAQIELLQSIVSLCNGVRNHGFTITTHSPYILNYLNVMIMRNMRSVTDKPSIDAEGMNVYAVQNGGVLDLIQANTVTGFKSVNAEWLNEAMRSMFCEYKELKGKDAGIC